MHKLGGRTGGGWEWDGPPIKQLEGFKGATKSGAAMNRILPCAALLFLLWRNRVSGAETALFSPRGVEKRVHPILECIKKTDVGSCLQRSVFGFLEDWLLNGEEAGGLDRSDEDLASMHPYLAKVVNGLADAVTVWNGGTTDVEEDENDEETARGDETRDPLPQEGKRN